MSEGDFDKKENGEGETEKKPVIHLNRQQTIETAGTEIDGDGADNSNGVKPASAVKFRVVTITTTGRPTAMRSGNCGTPCRLSLMNCRGISWSRAIM